MLFFSISIPHPPTFREEPKNEITSRKNICPIEVKSGKNYTLSSLNKIRMKYSGYIGQSYIIHTQDYAEKDDVIYLPIYMAYML